MVSEAAAVTTREDVMAAWRAKEPTERVCELIDRLDPFERSDDMRKWARSERGQSTDPFDVRGWLGG